MREDVLPCIAESPVVSCYPERLAHHFARHRRSVGSPSNRKHRIVLYRFLTRHLERNNLRPFTLQRLAEIVSSLNRQP